MSDSSESKVFTPWVGGRAVVNETKRADTCVSLSDVRLTLPPIRGVVFAQAVPDDEIAAMKQRQERARVEALERDYARLVDENAILRRQGCGRYEDSLKPTPPTLPPVKGATGVRRNSLAEQRLQEGEDATADEKLSREGARKCVEDTNPHRFKGDEGCWFRHVGRRGRILVYPVSREHDFGARGSVDDGGCCGAIMWEGAKASSALIATGLPKKHFRIRCKEPGVGGLCVKCVRKQNPNFFTDKLRVKGKGSEYNGMTHYQFMKENLEY